MVEKEAFVELKISRTQTIPKGKEIFKMTYFFSCFLKATLHALRGQISSNLRLKFFFEVVFINKNSLFSSLEKEERKKKEREFCRPEKT